MGRHGLSLGRNHNRRQSRCPDHIHFRLRRSLVPCLPFRRQAAESIVRIRPAELEAWATASSDCGRDYAPGQREVNGLVAVVTGMLAPLVFAKLGKVRQSAAMRLRRPFQTT